MASTLLKTLKHRPLVRLLSVERAVPVPAFSTSGTVLPATVDSLPSAGPAPSSDGGKKGVLSKLLLFLPGAATFGLGTWQLLRRQEKIEMLEYRRNRLAMDPIQWNDVPAFHESLSSLEFRKLYCEGFFDDSKSIFVGPRSRSISGVTENGYYVITPLVPISNDPNSVQPAILVNRGWVPREWRKKHRPISQDEPLKLTELEEKPASSWWMFWSKKTQYIQTPENMPSSVKVTGVIRGSERPSIFVPENSPSDGQWFYVDVQMIAQACGLPENTIYIEDINENVNPSNPYPLPKDAKTLIHHSVMPQDHLNYTFTWYTLSAAVTFMAFKRIRTRDWR